MFPWIREILNRKVSIRVTILTIFVIVFVLLSSIALCLQYYFSLDLAHSAANRAFKSASSETRENIESLDFQTNGLVEALTHYVDLLSQYKRIDSLAASSNEYPYLSMLTGVMQRNRYISAMYVSLEGSDFLELIKLEASEQVRENLGAQNSDRWAVVTIAPQLGVGVRKVAFFDAKLALRETRLEPTDYTPSNRPWFRLGLEHDGVVRTPPYHFAIQNTPGVTYAMRLASGHGVVGVDLSLEALSAFLRKQEIYAGCELALFNPAGDVLAYGRAGKESGVPSGAPQPAPVMQQVMERTLGAKETSKLERITVDGQDYYAYAEHLTPDLPLDLFLGITVPVAVISGPYMEQVTMSLVVTLGLLLLLTPLIRYLASCIVHPIRALSQENEKVRLRRFEDVLLVDSRIKEVFDLSASIVNMAHSIKAHEESQRALMDAIIKLVAGAIDAKSPYTGGHCSRVPVIAAMLAKAASDATSEPFAAFGFTTEDQWREFHIAAWLHDCGKVTTPEYVVDKATKLETIHNRIHEIRTRFEVLLRDAQIDYYRALAEGNGNPGVLKAELAARQEAIREDFAFVAQCNIGGEFMSEDKVERLKSIANRTWMRTLDSRLGISQEERLRLKGVAPAELPVRERVLEDRPDHIVPRTQDPFGDNVRGFSMNVPEHLYNHGELYNLCIRKGTLTAEERFKINEHIIQSIIMLEALPLPEGLTHVPEFAGAHHETLIGTGYPRRLKKEDMSIPARIMSVADVFEALTASDRPYKPAKSLSQALRIMNLMVKDRHLDPDLFELLISSGVYLEYAKKYLAPEQLDAVDVSKLIRNRTESS